MRELWMLVDLEPGYERFEVGDQITPTCYWMTSREIPGGVPDALIAREVPVHVEFNTDRGRSTARLRFSGAVTALVSTWAAPTGKARVDGLLLYDRYQWTQDREVISTVTVMERTGLIRARDLYPTSSAGWYAPEYFGPNKVWTGSPPDGYDYTWHSVRVSDRVDRD